MHCYISAIKLKSDYIVLCNILRTLKIFLIIITLNQCNMLENNLFNIGYTCRVQTIGSVFELSSVCYISFKTLHAWINKNNFSMFSGIDFVDDVPRRQDL